MLVRAVLEFAEQFQPHLDPADRFQPTPGEEFSQGFVRFTARKRAVRQVVDQLHGLQAVEPAVEGRQQGRSTGIVATQLVPDLLKAVELKKLPQTGGDLTGLFLQGGAILIRPIRNQAQPCPQHPEAGRMIEELFPLLRRPACAETLRPVPNGTRWEARGDGWTIVPASCSTPTVRASCCRK